MGKELKRTFSVTESGGHSSSKKAKTTFGKRTFAKKATSSKYHNSEGNTPEVKFIDQTVNVDASQAGVVQLVNAIIQGTTATTRVGQKIEMTSIEYDLVVAATTTELAASSSVGGSDAYKIALVYDKQSNGAAPAYTDVWQAVTAINSPMTHRNINNLDRFDVLATEYGWIDSASRLMLRHQRYVKCKLDVRFNTGNAGTVADIQSGALYIMIADQGGVSPNLLGYVRVRFHDM